MSAADDTLAEILRLERLAEDSGVSLADLRQWILDHPDGEGETPGLVGIAVGEKRRGGLPTGGIALVHHVVRKLPADWLPHGSAPVPPTIEVAGRDVPTDVVAWDAVASPLGPTAIVRPETSIGDSRGSRGTLGAIVWHHPGNQPVALSARHVLGREREPVFHPAKRDGGHPLGPFVAAAYDSEGDFAICSLGGRRADPAGAVSGVAVRGFHPVEVGTPVVMYGVKSSWCQGVVRGYGEVTFRGGNGLPALAFWGMEIVPHPNRTTPGPFTRDGDSGGCWFLADAAGHPTGWMAGLHVAGAKNGQAAFAVPASTIAQRFGLSPAEVAPRPASFDRSFAVAARDGAILRGLPDPAGQRLSLLPRGAPVAVVSRQGEWAAVDLVGDGAIDGFVHMSLIADRGGPMSMSEPWDLRTASLGPATGTVGPA